MAVAFLAETGVKVVRRSEVNGTLDNYGQGALTPDAVYELGRAADHPEAEAVVLSCTDMRSVEIIARLEAKLGKPVITSNQAIGVSGHAACRPWGSFCLGLADLLVGKST